MNSFYLLIAIVHYGINIFFAGYESHNYSVKDKTIKGYVSMVLITLFWINFASLLFISTIIYYVLCQIYKRTYLNYAITTFRTWYKYVYMKGEITLYGSKLSAFKENVMIKRMPLPLQKWWIKFINAALDKQRKKLFEETGEIPKW